MPTIPHAPRSMPSSDATQEALSVPTTDDMMAEQEMPTTDEIISEQEMPTTDKGEQSPRSSRVFNHLLIRTSTSVSTDENKEPKGQSERQPRRLSQSKTFAALASPPMLGAHEPRRTKSFSLELLSDWNITVTVEKNDTGCRELKMSLRCCGRDARFAIQLRSLLFWLVILLACIPTRAFQLVPGMPMGGVVSSTAQGTLHVNRHLGVSSTPPRDVPIASKCNEAAGGAVANLIERLQADQPANVAGLFELCEARVDADGHSYFEEEELDGCLVDAESEEEVAACVRTQIKSSTLEELSAVIAKEGAEMLEGMSMDEGMSTDEDKPQPLTLNLTLNPSPNP